jgi:S-formylglutathione hydrolase FrmB
MQFYYSTVSKTYRKCFIYLPPAYDTRSAEKYPVLFLQHGMNETQYSWHMQGKVNFILDNLIAEGKALPMIIVMENGMTAVNYTSLVIDDLIPFLQENYKVKTGKPNTAVAGLSMGSYQATDLGLANSDKFGYVGAFCGGTDLNLSSISNQINDSIEVLFNGLYQFAPLLFKPYTYENHFSAIEDNSQKAFSMYPNPAEGQIHLEFNEDEDLMNACYELNDITGRQILSFTGDKSDAETKISAALQSSSGALYILLVHTQKSVYQAKILN